MGSVASPLPTLPNIESLRALFPSGRRGRPEYSVAYVYAGVALLAFGEEKRIPDLWRQIALAHAGGGGSEAAPAQAAIDVAARRLREGMAKASPLVGFPRAINALAALHQSVKQTRPGPPSDLFPPSPSPSASSSSPDPDPDPGPRSAAQRRGQALFDATYGPHAARVRGDLDAVSGGVLGGFAVGCVYGGLLAEAEGAAGEDEDGGEDGGGEGKERRRRRLSAKEGAGLVFVACLAAGQGAQAKGHMYGARNLGNSGEEIRAMVELVVRLADSLMVGLGLEEMGFLEKLKDW